MIYNKIPNDLYANIILGLPDGNDACNENRCRFSDLDEINSTKLIYASTMYFVTDDSDDSRLDEIRKTLYDMLISYMSDLSPSEFERIFPIDKVYNEEKCCCIDYFYTKRMISKLPQDKPIGEENIVEFIVRYRNNTIMEFLTRYLNVLERIRLKQGKESILKEFLNSQCS